MVPSVIDLISSRRQAITEADPAITGPLPAPGRHPARPMPSALAISVAPRRNRGDYRSHTDKAASTLAGSSNRLPSESGILRNPRNAERLVPQHRPHRLELLARIARFPAEVGMAFIGLACSIPALCAALVASPAPVPSRP